MRFYLPSLALFLFACDSDKGITVFNPGPEAEISSHSDGDEVLEGMVITFEGNVTDEVKVGVAFEDISDDTEEEMFKAINGEARAEEMRKKMLEKKLNAK